MRGAGGHLHWAASLSNCLHGFVHHAKCRSSLLTQYSPAPTCAPSSRPHKVPSGCVHHPPLSTAQLSPTREASSQPQSWPPWCLQRLPLPLELSPWVRVPPAPAQCPHQIQMHIKQPASGIPLRVHRAPASASCTVQCTCQGAAPRQPTSLLRLAWSLSVCGLPAGPVQLLHIVARVPAV